MEWSAALYGRVSTDRTEQQESIKEQEEALIQYAEDNGFNIWGRYFDEGYSGTNFDRPEIKRLKEDIEKDEVNLVIVKDLSRIGRNNALTLLFLEYLNFKNVRLISISDGYDSFKDEDDLVGIKTWYNERYSKDLSKKIKFALRHKKNKGEYLTAFAPYGYRKSSNIKNKLEVDPFAASIVREIFNLYINGFGFNSIANILNERGILNPSRYGNYGRKSDRWSWTTIRGIISNPVYTGCAVQQKYYKKTFKSPNISRAPRSLWIWTENTHEPIIEKELYDMAQQILKKRNGNRPYRKGSNTPHLFTSFLYCYECGSSLYYKKDKNNKGVYRCGTYIKYGSAYCSSHYIGEDELKEIICNQLKDIIKKNIDCTALEKEILDKCCQDDKYRDNKLAALEHEAEQIKRKMEILYMDRLNCIIGENIFHKLYNELNSQLLEIEKQKFKEDRINQKSQSDKSMDTQKFVRKFLNMDVDIDREIVEWMIDRIYVCSDGSIIIAFKFHV